MGISLKTHKMLWGRAGNRCAICRKELVMDITQTDDPSIIGDECHIRAKSPNGPRYDPNFPLEKIDKYENLILLCKNCHKLIDDRPNKYTIDHLLEIKTNHENWVKESLSSFEEDKQRDEEIYADYIET